MTSSSIRDTVSRRAQALCEASIPATLTLLACWHSSTTAPTVRVAGALLAMLALWQSAQTAAGAASRSQRKDAGSGRAWATLLVPLVLLAKGADAPAWAAPAAQAMALESALFWGAEDPRAPPMRRRVGVWAAGVGALAWGSGGGGGGGSGGGTVAAALAAGCLGAAQHWLAAYAMSRFPRSFTMGEAAVGAQAVLLAAAHLAAGAAGGGSVAGATAAAEAACVALLALAQALATATAGARAYTRRGAAFLVLSPAFAALAVALAALASGASPAAWALHAALLLGAPAHLAVLGYWALLLAAAGALAARTRWLGAGAETGAAPPTKLQLHVRRKAYHLLATALFAPALLHAPLLLHLGFTAALAAFVLAECLRALRVPGYSAAIDAFLRRFTDHRDTARLVTSHFHLLLGCALPLWLGGPSRLAQLSGVLALGLADSAASLAGVRFGSHRWWFATSRSPKSIEGSAAFALVLFGACCAAGHVAGELRAWPWLALVCALMAALEALTEQNDNLVVPLAMYAAVHVLLLG
ncbi:hypothetical protein BX661DRAFT_200222 [Kickxella alabastrina]|uniref:uncharacterized protein n=1 Tax=Kickxella alabastrina TaxID=61397 RepID=UPI00222129A8|nr:uncharacterized protein BX661DRAFT_200222 [Kickxella alabastrina]KAI7823115.1 hypothetical protein BX661DRAFT_200222 [Kickxella alabastrina]